MEEHITNGAARRLDDFTDSDGMRYKQYMFLFPGGHDSKFIRRIPVATKGMDKWAYEALLNKYETPNGARLLMEVGQVKELYNKHGSSNEQKA